MTTLTNSRKGADRRRLRTAFDPSLQRPLLKTTARPRATQAESIALHDGGHLLLREIQPADVEALRRGFYGLTPDQVRMRFLHPMNELPEELARQLCEVERDHAVAFVLIDPPGTPAPEIHAVARAYVDPVTLAAEFALVVQQSYTGHGLGTLLMQRLVAACRELGATELWGNVLGENDTMLKLCSNLGFQHHTQYQDAGLQRVVLAL
jgi:acetyltransferase